MNETQIVVVPQLYYWHIKFEDGTFLSQYDSYGNEILIANIITENNTFIDERDGKRKPKAFTNYFSAYEELHGRVTDFELLPFNKEMKEKCESKQNMICVIDSSIRPITKIIPPEYYATFLKQNHIDYGMNAVGDMVGQPAGRLAKFILVLANRENLMNRETIEINFSVGEWKTEMK